MYKPFITIIIPTYNRAWSINRAIDSCLNQTYKNFEIVITDDGSSDNTKKKVLEYKNDKIRYFKFKKNKGVIKARNNCILNSNGEWILLFDSDDELTFNCLEVFVNAIEALDNKKIQILFAHFKNTLTNETKIGKKFQKKLENNKILTYHDFLCMGVAMGDMLPIVKKEVFNKRPYNTEVKRNMNVVWHQFFQVSDVLVLNNYLGICHTEGADRITGNRVNDASLWVEGVKEYLNLFEDYILMNCPRAIALHYRSLALYEYEKNDIKSARKSLFLALKYNPLDYKSIIYLFATFNAKLFRIIWDR